MDIEKLKQIQREIETISKAANRLRKHSGGVQAIDRNASRILASTRMLEINISDLLEIL
jgi:hypothetical protein